MLSGDVKVAVYQIERKYGREKTKVLLQFWFNTFFLRGGTALQLEKMELDKANKDKSHTVFPQTFQVTMMFAPGGDAETASNGIRKDSSFSSFSPSSISSFPLFSSSAQLVTPVSPDLPVPSPIGSVPEKGMTYSPSGSFPDREILLRKLIEQQLESAVNTPVSSRKTSPNNSLVRNQGINQLATTLTVPGSGN